MSIFFYFKFRCLFHIFDFYHCYRHSFCRKLKKLVPMTSQGNSCLLMSWVTNVKALHFTPLRPQNTMWACSMFLIVVDVHVRKISRRCFEILFKGRQLRRFDLADTNILFFCERRRFLIDYLSKISHHSILFIDKTYTVFSTAKSVIQLHSF